jgi:hypothetical protein
MDTNLIIVFEGPDNCGKTTQINKISNVYKKEYSTRCVKMIKFPRYNTLHGAIIKDMLNSDSCDIVNDKKNYSIFSQIQLKDKMDALEKDIFPFIYDDKNLFSRKYLFLDRYTLSSRIYDAAKAYIVNNGDNIREYINYYKENGKLSSDQMYDFISFIKDWIFGLGYIKDQHLLNEYQLGYNMLENNIFNIVHVIFKSSEIIRGVTKTERDFDQHEKDTVFNGFINYIYDNITEPYLYGHVKHRFLDAHNTITVDSDKIILNYLCGDYKNVLLTDFSRKMGVINAVSEYIYGEIKKL